MREPLFEIRYPDGTFEIRTSAGHPPEIGETIRHRETLWKVIDRNEDERVIVRVEAVPSRSSSSVKR